MKPFTITPISIKRVGMTLLLIAIAFSLRAWPLGSTGTRFPWLTFYPAVMLVAVYGGIISGIIGTFLSCALLSFAWGMVSLEPFLKTFPDYLGMYFFIFTCIMISVVAESMRLANRRAKLAQEKAQLANQAKSVFLANMSHELRTPLNAILGYTQLAQNEANLQENQRQYLSVIQRSGEHLLSLINDVLTIAKIESKKAENEKLNFNFHKFIRELTDMFTLQARSKEVELNIKGIENVPEFIIADQNKLKVVLINLLGNALKFTQKGEINLILSIVRAQDGTNRLHIAVDDTGYGISKEQQKNLFQYFYQTDSGISSKTGSGLGLAISQDYVNLMGGQLMVESELGIGSSFYFDIELLQGEAEREEVNTIRRIIGFEKMQIDPKILIADDNFENRYLLKRILANIGFTVMEAENGREVIDIFESKRPDLIFMDIRMPVMSGLEATKIIKTKPDNGKVKIIALSAHVFKDETDEILHVGCDDYIAKPFKENEIFEILSKHLGITYVYEEMNRNENLLPKTIDINRDMLVTISKELISELNEAIVELNGKEILRSIEIIKRENESIGDGLEAIARTKDYAKLFKLTESRQKHQEGAITQDEEDSTDEK